MFKEAIRRTEEVYSCVAKSIFTFAIHLPFILPTQTMAFTMQLICSNTKSFICLLEFCDITVEGQPEWNNKPTETTGWEMHQAQPEDTANAAAQQRITDVNGLKSTYNRCKPN